MEIAIRRARTADVPGIRALVDTYSMDRIDGAPVPPAVHEQLLRSNTRMLLHLDPEDAQ